jgi:signal transduction histidine kinase
MEELLKSKDTLNFNKLKYIHKQYCDSVRIQGSSTKLLTFLVNDILDFGQLSAGKFRKDCINFCLQESTEEIILILQYKAEMYGINIDVQFLGFPLVSATNKICIDYTVNSDMQRY